ncbi:MAG TPA: enoyl-CoA hydratase/isomerase family protein, partial [Candidatus Eisenbacteria bacterium]|nr:enoyl-CoA hydratase/isomerase family protein [Candidatus Eisenbacteria bacterium]
ARAVVLAATGKHFSAGADVGEHLPPAFRDLIPEMVGTVEAIASLPVPVIAAVRGRCLGGGFELVQAADIVVAGESASFGQPEILLGVTAPIACALLPRRGPYGHAAEILFTGDPIGATRAAASGFVQRLVPDDQVESEARAIAARCARHSAAALHATKRTLRAAVGRTRPEALQAAAAIYLEEVMDTRDALEGLRAFTEKRTPVWEHR